MHNPFESELERLARTLTEQFGVQVVCRGDNAWTDGRRIVVPLVPDPMDEGLERMMLGYLDHELGHVAFSDFEVAAEFEKKHPGRLDVLNVVEDALIERKAMQRWPGVRRNLDRMFEQVRPRVLQLIQKRGALERFCTAVYLKLSHHNQMLGLEKAITGYEDLLDRFPFLCTTKDAAGLAEELLNRWTKRQPPQPQKQTKSGGDQRSTGRSGSRKRDEEDDNSAAGQSRGQHGAKDDPHDRSECQTSPQDEAENAADTPGATEETAGQEAEDEADPQDDSSCSSGSGEPKQSENQDSNPAGAPSEHNNPGPQPPVRPGVPRPGGSLIAEALREAINQAVAQLDGCTQYRPFTKQYDRIEVVAPADEADVQALLSTGKDTVRRLRRGLTNTLRSAEKRWWRDDQLRGELSPRSLYRLCTDRSGLDVFRKKSVVQGQSTAVGIVLDASGSMTSSKMDVARRTMRVLVEALADLRVATEAFTFTTGDQVDVNQVIREAGQDINAFRERYGRIENLEIGLIKRFEEPIKTALQRLPSVKGTGLTPLGEAMQIGASRIIQRPENRKIMLVLTDGKAGCEGGGSAAHVHAQETAQRIARAGIELVGVGILDANVSEIIKDSIVVTKIEDLPAQLCKLLGRTLQKGVCYVG